MLRGTRPGIFACVGIVAFVAAASAARAQDHQDEAAAAAPQLDAKTERPVLKAVKIEKAPKIDGLLDEPAWDTVPAMDQFTQQEPRIGEAATERTEVRVWRYESKHLFIAVHAYDSDPSGIVATEMRRDGNRILEEDNFQIILDTFMDSRSAYMFVVRPLGAMLDQQISEEGAGSRGGSSGNINRDWDGVWHAATRRTADGWTAEIAIPMVTLRFPDAAVQSWGLNFQRTIARKSEFVFWAPIPREYSLMRVSLAGALTDLEALDRGVTCASSRTRSLAAAASWPRASAIARPIRTSGWT